MTEATMCALRPIAPLDLAGVTPKLPAGPRPRMIWLRPSALLVDESYQRRLSKESRRLIKRLAADFAWERMKPPVVVEAAANSFHIIDGQHTAIAAASIGLPEIPVFVVAAKAAAARAAAFVGHNTDRLKVSPITIYKALLAAEDPDAMDVANVCRRAGVRIRNFNQASIIAEGDTSAVISIRALIKRRGVSRARAALEVLVKGRRAPISGREILAIEKLMFRLREGCDGEALGRIIAAAGEEGFFAACTEAARVRRPLPDILAERWAEKLDQLSRKIPR